MRIYIHIPFCEEKCRYCRFALTTNLDDVKVAFYISFLVKEIEKFEYSWKEIESIYFWWWTPWVLKIKYLEKIFEILRKKFNLKENLEINFETTPQKVTLENIKSWQKLWINRLSMWVQSFNPQTLKEVTRKDSKEIIKAFENLEKSSFDNVNIDFIIWLPYSQKWDISRDIKKALDLCEKIKHISVYMLEDYNYPKRWENICMEKSLFEDEYQQAFEVLKKEWFERYELSNFAKKGFESQHNRWYRKHDEMIWFWLDAHSFINSERFANSSNFAKYYRWEIAYREKIWEKEKFQEMVIFSLRMWWFHKKLAEKLDKKWLEEMIENKLLDNSENMIKLTKKWTPLLDFILSKII